MTTHQPVAHPRCEEQQRPATIPTPTQHCGGCPMSCWILGPSPYMDSGLPWGGMGDEFPILYSIDPPGHSHDGQRQQHKPIPAPGPSIRVMPALCHMGGYPPQWVDVMGRITSGVPRWERVWGVYRYPHEPANNTRRNRCGSLTPLACDHTQPSKDTHKHISALE